MKILISADDIAHIQPLSKNYMLLVNFLLYHDNTNTIENVSDRSMFDFQRVCSLIRNVQTNSGVQSGCVSVPWVLSLGLKRPGSRSKKGKATEENCVISSSIICALRHLLEQRLQQYVRHNHGFREKMSIAANFFPTHIYNLII